MSLAGLVIEGKYRILRLIGEGGMGAVYEAEHLRVHRHLAVKFLSTDLAQDRDAVTRFQREAEAAGQIGHDNICEVLDIGFTQQGLPYLIMPLLRGTPLNKVLTESGRLPVARACDIAEQTLTALSAAHAVGIVHRDLKPENLFVTRVGDRDDFVKVLDFGISKVMRSPTLGGREKNLTKTGSVLGTPSYMAPEQARGARDIDHRVDVYAVGVILYEMLTGKRPFDADTFNEILWNIWNAPVTAPRALRHDLSPELEAVVLRAMARDREQRYPSAEAFRAALAELGARASRPAVAQTLPTARDSTAPRVAPASAPPAVPAPRPIVRPVAAPTMTPAGETVGKLTSLRQPRRRAAMVIGALGLSILVAGVLLMVAYRGNEQRRAGDAADLVAAANATPTPAPAPAVAVPPPGPPAAGAGAPSLPAGAPPPRSDADAAGATVPEAAGSAVLPPSPPAPPPDAGAAVVAAPDAADLVRITLTNMPAGAAITVDGRPVAGPDFDLPRSAKTVQVVVRADGWQRWQQRVSAAQSAEVPVRMQRVGARPPARDAGGAQADAVGAADAGGRTVIVERVDAGPARDGRGVVEGTIRTFGGGR